MQLLKKNTLNPEITLLYQFHAHANFMQFLDWKWPPPPWNFPENSSDFVQPPFPKTDMPTSARAVLK